MKRAADCDQLIITRLVKRPVKLSKETIKSTHGGLNRCSLCRRIEDQINTFLRDLIREKEYIQRPGGKHVITIKPSFNSHECDLCPLFASILPPKDEIPSRGMPLHCYSMSVHLGQKTIQSTKAKYKPGCLLFGFRKLRSTTKKTHDNENAVPADHYSPWGFLVPLHDHVRSINASVKYSTLKAWLDHCDNSHKHKSKTETFPEATASLKVLDCYTREVEVLPSGEEYVCLSYVWGAAQSQNLSHGFPAVIEDAMDVVRELGYRYIWIDRYCIDQNNAKEKHHQISKMHLVYQNATFTIIDAAGQDPHTGLQGIEKRARCIKPSATICGIRFQAWTWARQRVRESKWMTRGWVYQEAIFSRRRLIFTADQVYFECDKMNCLEGITDYLESYKSHPQHSMFPYFDKTNQSPKNIIEIFAQLPPADGAASILQPTSIDRHISSYSKRQLSYDRDIINGMLGLFEAYESSSVPVFHIWGVPCERRLVTGSYMDLAESLSRSLIRHLCFMHKAPCLVREEFPSWSWAGWKGAADWDCAWEPPPPRTTVDVEFNNMNVELAVFLIQAKQNFRVLNMCRVLSIHAIVHELRFVHLSNVRWKSVDNPTIGLPTQLSGFFAVLQKRRLYYGRIHWLSRLYLSVEAPPGSKLFERLCNEKWLAIQLGADYGGKPSSGHFLIVQEVDGICTRIGYVPGNVSFIAEEPYRLPFGTDYVPPIAGPGAGDEWRKIRLA